MNPISFECREATDKERQFTALQLKAHTEKALGSAIDSAPFGLMAYDDKTLVGSIVGKVFFGWLHIDLIWVADNYQRRGMGTRLMALATEQAVAKGLQGIEVWTQSWQAPEFYRKLGYDEFAVIDDFAPGRKRHAFRRHLKQTP